MSACANIERMQKATLLGILGTSSEGLFLRKIPYTHWSIISFNPKQYEVCVRISSYLTSDQLDTQINALEALIAALDPSALRTSLERQMRKLIAQRAHEDELEDTLSDLRSQFAVETDPAQKVLLENAIISLTMKMNNRPQITVTFLVPTTKATNS